MVEFGAMESDEQKLIEKAKNGDKEAFGDVYKLFVQRVFRFVYYMTGDRLSAEDITQNTFVKAWRNIALYNPERGRVATFLFAVARNLVIDEQRKKKNISLENTGEIETSDDAIERLSRIEARESVTKIMKSLDEDEKQFLILRYFEELSFAQIGSIFGMKETAVRVRVHRILRKLRKSF